MLRLNQSQREILANKLPDFATAHAETQSMTGVYVLLGGIAFFAGAITLYDLIAERVNRKAHKN